MAERQIKDFKIQIKSYLVHHPEPSVPGSIWIHCPERLNGLAFNWMNVYELLTSGRRGLVANQTKAPRKPSGSVWGSLLPLLFRITLITICSSSKEPKWACGKLEGRSKWFLRLSFTYSLLKGPSTLILGQDPVVRVSVGENEPTRLAKIKLIGSTQCWQGCRETGSLGGEWKLVEPFFWGVLEGGVRSEGLGNKY